MVFDFLFLSANSWRGFLSNSQRGRGGAHYQHHSFQNGRGGGNYQNYQNGPHRGRGGGGRGGRGCGGREKTVFQFYEFLKTFQPVDEFFQTFNNRISIITTCFFHFCTYSEI